MHLFITIGRMLAVLLLLSSFHKSANGSEADVRDRLEAELLSLSEEFFEGDETRIDDFVDDGIQHDYGPAWFVRAARQFLQVEGNGQELKSAVLQSLSHGVGSAGPLLSFVVNKSDNQPSEDVAAAERALAGMENVSIVGEAHSILFFRNLVIAFPQTDPGQARFWKFVERQYKPALGRGSPLAVAFGLSEGKPSTRRIQLLCAILRKTYRDQFQRCKAAGEFAIGNAPELDGAILKKNATEFRESLVLRFGLAVDSYERAVCSTLRPGEYRNVICTDFLAAALSLCSIRTNENHYRKVNNMLVCRKKDVEGFGQYLRQIVEAELNKDRVKD